MSSSIVRLLSLSAAALAVTFVVSACTKSEESADSGAGEDVESAAAAAEEKMVTTSTGLQYEVLASGSGASPKASDSVTVHYRGTLVDGTEFDSSHKRGKPAVFPVNRVIPGWTEALQLMKEGDKWKLTIPPALAYGDRGAGALIPPNSTLIFEVELIKVN